MEGESNASVYRIFAVSSMGEGMCSGVVNMEKRNSLSWFGHLEKWLSATARYTRVEQVMRVRGQPL